MRSCDQVGRGMLIEKSTRCRNTKKERRSGNPTLRCKGACSRNNVIPGLREEDVPNKTYWSEISSDQLYRRLHNDGRNIGQKKTSICCSWESSWIGWMSIACFFGADNRFQVISCTGDFIMMGETLDKRKRRYVAAENHHGSVEWALLVSLELTIWRV